MSGIKKLRTNASKIEKTTKGISEFIAEIIDKDSFVQTDVFMAGESFFDGSEALGEGVLCGYGLLHDYPVTIIAQNEQVLGGSLGKAHADKIAKAIDIAQKTNTPLISIIDSRGARLGEGLSALEGYGSIIAKVARLKKSVPHIAIIKGNAIGHMSIYAQTADIVFMNNDSLLSFNPPLAILASEDSAKSPKEAFSLKEYTEKSNTCNLTYENTKDIRQKIHLLFNYMQKPVIENNDDPNRVTAKLNTETTPQAILEALCDDKKYLELQANFATSVRVLLTSINSIAVGIVQTQGGEESGLLDVDAIVKIKNFISFLQAYHIPLVTLVDCDGVKSSIQSELKGLSALCSKLTEEIALSDISKIAVVTGRAIGFAYTALCSKSLGFNYTLTFADSTLLPTTPDIAVGAASSQEIEKAANPVAAREKLTQSYEQRIGNPFVAGKEGYIDNIIEPALIRPYVASILTVLER